MNDKDVIKSYYSKPGFQNSESNHIFKMEENTFPFYRKITYKFILMEIIKIEKIKGNF